MIDKRHAWVPADLAERQQQRDRRRLKLKLQQAR